MKKNPPSGRSLTISFDLLDPVDKTFDGGGGVGWGGGEGGSHSGPPVQ